MHSMTARTAISEKKRLPLAERFWSKVDRRGDDECWPWTRARQRIGYGIIGLGSRLDGSKRGALAHRLAWELTHGPIAGKAVKVLHSCDNRCCCNPAHLFLGTQADNVADMIRKGRQNFGGLRAAPRSRPGSKHPMARLSDSDVRAIRCDTRSLREISAHYGISMTYACMVRARRVWRHLR